MLLGRTCLTRLRLGYYPTLLPPLLNSLVELQEAAEAAAEAAGSSASSRRGSGAASAAAGGAAQWRLQNAASQATANAAPAAAQAHVASSSSAAGPSRAHADRADQQQPNNAAPLQPPPLRELSVTLSPYMNFARDSFNVLVQLTRLTSLRIGWLVRPEHQLVAESVTAVLPLQQQRELSQLVQLVELGLGWAPSNEVLRALGFLTGALRQVLRYFIYGGNKLLHRHLLQWSEVLCKKKIDIDGVWYRHCSWRCEWSAAGAKPAGAASRARAWMGPKQRGARGAGIHHRCAGTCYVFLVYGGTKLFDRQLLQWRMVLCKRFWRCVVSPMQLEM
jgi:hypothetical protein